MKVNKAKSLLQVTSKVVYPFFLVWSGMLIYIVLFYFLLSVDRENEYNVPHVEGKSTRPSFSMLTMPKKGKTVSSWEIKDYFSCTVLAVCNFNIDATRTVEVRYICFIYSHSQYKSSGTT